METDCDVPHDLLCPITHEIFYDPVMLVEDGQTYEKEAIEEWLGDGKRKRSPVTNTVIQSTKTSTNHIVKKFVSSFLEKNPKYIKSQYIPKKLSERVKKATKEELMQLIKDHPQLLLSSVDESTVFHTICEGKIGDQILLDWIIANHLKMVQKLEHSATWNPGALNKLLYDKLGTKISVDFVKTLLELGANPKAEFLKGNALFQVARAFKGTEIEAIKILELLFEHGMFILSLR